MSRFSERFKELRKSRKLSQQNLADLLRTSKSSVNMYERGEREPGLEMLEAIADFFNVDMDYLLGKTSTANIMLVQCELSERERIHISDYRQLNGAGQNKVDEYTRDLLNSGRYSKGEEMFRAASSEDNHPAEIVEITPEEKERLDNATRITPENGDF